MLIGLYIDRTLKSWCDVHPRNHGKVDNIFNMALTMFKYSFASLKLGGVFRKHRTSITVHFKAHACEITPPVLFDLLMLCKHPWLIVYIYDCSFSCLYVSHISYQLDFLPTNQPDRWSRAVPCLPTMQFWQGQAAQTQDLSGNQSDC